MKASLFRVQISNVTALLDVTSVLRDAATAEHTVSCQKIATLPVLINDKHM